MSVASLVPAVALAARVNKPLSQRQLELSVMTGTPSRSDPLRYEKTLIDNWLDREFPRRNG